MDLESHRCFSDLLTKLGIWKKGRLKGIRLV